MSKRLRNTHKNKNFEKLHTVLHQCCGAALVLMRIRIHFFISMRIQIRIRIKAAKPMWIHVDPNADPGQTLKSQKVEFLHNNKIFSRIFF
jgi:hypothetical protein